MSSGVCHRYDLGSGSSRKLKYSCLGQRMKFPGKGLDLWFTWACGIPSVVWVILRGLEYSGDCSNSETGQSSYSRNTLITMNTLRNGLWDALVGLPLARV